MLLTDTSALVALIDRRDPAHDRCLNCFMAINDSMLTTWPCLTETAYFLYRSGGWHLVDALRKLSDSGRLSIHQPNEASWGRVMDLMYQYRSLPCDLADASLAAAAEDLNVRRIFTLDSHFYALRIGGVGVFEVVPQAAAP